MDYQVALLVFGILLLILGLIGKVKAKELEVGTDSKFTRFVIGSIGTLLIALSIFTAYSDVIFPGMNGGGPNDEIDSLTQAPGLETNTSDPSVIASTEPAEMVIPNTSLVASPAYFGSDGAIFSFSSDIAATFQCQLDDAGWKSCVSPHRIRGVEDGRHIFQVRAVNALDQPDPTAEQASWVSDTGPPVISMSVDTTSGQVRDNRTNPPTVSTRIDYVVDFTVTDQLSRIAKNECRVGGRQYASCQSPWRGRGTSSLERVWIRSTDSVGNVREARCTPAPRCQVVPARR